MMTKKEIQERNAEWLRLGKQLLQQRSAMRRLGLDPQCYLMIKLAAVCPQWPITLNHAAWILEQLQEGE
jgi:hypothetical protein